jgi:Winged helix DNA-binding domain
MSDWTRTQARAARLRSLLLGPHQWRTADEVVTWFGAMQAQDLASALWSLGLRLPGSTEIEMHTALEQRRFLRTWPMRGTIHLVPAQDAHWMLDLMGSTMMTTSHRRRESLGLTQEDTDRATAALADALAGNRRLTRSQALSTINDAGITTEGQRGYHLLWYAALTGVTCIGPQAEGEQTFVLLDDWVANPRRLDAREAAAELAYRYFRSHGPAPVTDFAGWTGLGLRITRTALSDNAGRLTSVTVDGEEMWLSTELADDPDAVRPLRRTIALPGFDELILGFKDRRLHIPEGRFDDIVPGGNGVFRSTIVSDGLVHGTWTRGITTKQVKVTLQPFAPLTTSRRAAVDHALGAYARYLGRSLALTVNAPVR